MNLSESYVKLKGEGTLENPVESGAEGVRRQGAESLRQKDRERTGFRVLCFSGVAALQRLCFCVKKGE